MTSGTVETNGVSLWYETFGNPHDPAILLVMGAGEQSTAWPAAFIQALVEGGRHVVRYDNRDSGLSTKLPSEVEYTLEDMAADAIGLLDHLSLQRVHVVGVSMGGMIAQILAIRWPERVISLTSIMSAADSPMGQIDPKLLEALAVPDPGTREGRIEQRMQLWRVIGGELTPEDEVELRKTVVEGIDRSWYPEAAQRHAGAIMRSPSRLEALSRLRMPALVIHGTADPLVPYDMGVATSKAIPGARLLTLEGAGHSMRAKDGPAVVQAILDVTSAA